METKRCSSCRKDRVVSEFSPNTHRAAGIQSACRRCRRLYVLRRRGARASIHHVELAELKLVCDLCEQEVDRIYIDHCHQSGNVRGFLCLNCNTGIGRFHDDPALLAKAIEYLTASPDLIATA